MNLRNITVQLVKFFPFLFPPSLSFALRQTRYTLATCKLRRASFMRRATFRPDVGSPGMCLLPPATRVVERRLRPALSKCQRLPRKPHRRTPVSQEERARANPTALFLFLTRDNSPSAASPTANDWKNTILSSFILFSGGRRKDINASADNLFETYVVCTYRPSGYIKAHGAKIFPSTLAPSGMIDDNNKSLRTRS